MNKLITKLFVGGAMTLVLSAIPAFATPLFSFTTTTAGGNFVADPTVGATVDSMTNIIFNTLNVAGTGSDSGSFSILNGFLSFNKTNDTLSLVANGITGTGASAGLGTLANSGTVGVAATIFTIQLTSPLLTGTGNSGTTGKIFFPTTATSLIGSAFFSDFGLFNTLTDTAIAGSGVSAGAGVSNPVTGDSGADKYTATSEQYNFNVTSTPEPMSFVLLGSGLIAISFIGRKRVAKAPVSSK
jgi:hypothetical protein